MTPNVVNPFPPGWQDYQHAQANPLPAQQGQQQLNTYPMQNVRPFTSMDALLGELLREVLEMRRDVEAVLAMLRAARQRGEQEMDYRGMVARGELPPNALRHGTPR